MHFINTLTQGCQKNCSRAVVSCDGPADKQMVSLCSCSLSHTHTHAHTHPQTRRLNTSSPKNIRPHMIMMSFFFLPAEVHRKIETFRFFSPNSRSLDWLWENLCLLMMSAPACQSSWQYWLTACHVREGLALHYWLQTKTEG